MTFFLSKKLYTFFSACSLYSIHSILTLFFFLLFNKIRFTVKSKAHVSIRFACVHEKRLQIFCGNACYRFVWWKLYIRWTVFMNKWPLCDGYLNEAILYQRFDVFCGLHRFILNAMIWASFDRNDNRPVFVFMKHKLLFDGHMYRFVSSADEAAWINCHDSKKKMESDFYNERWNPFNW